MALANQRWVCVASCNLQSIEGSPLPNPPRVQGQGSGPSQHEACRNAKRAATQRALLAPILATVSVSVGDNDARRDASATRADAER